ncbi:winged helix-turn-helix domain-containing protein [Streptomyces sp. NPDC006197]|uniref:ArsR/SmtB family transcription factor n=1 Tax=Streptomyces sp. NPDC006197 TaxID=3156685 RepID=UPI0033A96E55
MVALRLSVEDLSRVRFTHTLGAAFEAHLAEARYAGTRQDGFSEWRRKVRRRLRHRVPTPALQGLSGPPPSAEGRLFQNAAVEPFWQRIRGHLEQENNARLRSVLSEGVEGVLNQLHPDIGWQAPYLRVDTATGPEEIELAGEGLLITPSLFAEHPFVLEADRMPQGVPALVYNIFLDADTAMDIWREEEEDRDASLRELLGHTRANVLACVRNPKTTSEISRCLHISNPSASKHVGVLRRSGLVSTARQKGYVVHSLTQLGEAVLG